MVVCTHSVAPTADDPNRLSCASGELIELIEVTQNANDGSLTLVVGPLFVLKPFKFEFLFV